MTPYPYTLFTLEEAPNIIGAMAISHYVESRWSFVLEAMAEDFKNFPMVTELWLRKERAGSNDTVLLWKRS